MEEIRQLKRKCHFYLNQYIFSNMRVKNDSRHYQKVKRKAYHRLASKLKTDAFQCHFSKMNTVEQLDKALTILKEWNEE